VHSDLKTVIELQQVDLRIVELTTQMDSLPLQIQELQKQINDFLQAHEERKHRLGENQKERRSLEADIQEIRQLISKHKDQLYQVKTNEQYRAMLKEIESEEARILKIEDQILEKMIEAEDLGKLVQEAATRVESEKAKVAAEVSSLENERQADTELRERRLARRADLISALDANVFSLYERVRKGRRGVAVAEVRDGFCTACHVLLRPQVYNEVRANAAVMTCENCVRIIYYVEPPPAEGAPVEDQGSVTSAQS
jgi:predicted  nucleic acid-binding Zn-ribbon protein